MTVTYALPMKGLLTCAIYVFRPHSASTCYQTGYVKAGKITMRATGKCPAGPPKGAEWFDVYVRVQGNVAFIYLNNQVVLKTTTILPYKGRGESYSGL